MEAAWLAILVDLPLFFNKYASNSFEPEKIYVARSLTLVILGAWITKSVTASPEHSSVLSHPIRRFREFIRLPLILPIIGYTLAKLLATAFGIEPATSFWGNLSRGTGTYTDLSWLIVFAAIAVNVRSRAQVDRVVTTVIVTSVPISLYGLAQHFGVEPIFVTGGSFDTARVSSALGNPVFLAAYLGLVAPLALSRSVYFFRRSVSDSGSRLSNQVGTVLHLFVFLLLLVAIYFTRSRGASLGLFVGLFIMCFVLWTLRRRRRLVTVAVKPAVLIPLLFMLAICGGAIIKLRGTATLERFSEIVSPTVGTGLQRSILWHMAWDAATASRPLDLGAGRVDSRHLLRPVIGYGPETVEFVTRRFISRALVATYDGVYLVADRVHNDSWDTLLTEGLLGLVIRELLMGCLYWHAIKSLKLARPSHRRVFWTCLAGGACLGGASLLMWQTVAFLWLGLRLGTILGLMVFLVYGDWCNRPAVQDETPPPNQAPLIAALLAAFIAHSIETAFSFSIGTTGAYLWIYAGVLVAVGNVLQRSASTVPAEPRERPSDERARRDSSQSRTSRPRNKTLSAAPPNHHLQEIAGGALMALVMANLGFELLRKGNETSPAAIMVHALTRIPGTNDAFSPWIVGMLLVTSLSFATIWINENRSAEPDSSRFTSLRWVLIASMILAVSFWYVIALHLGSMRSLTPDNPDPSADLVRGYETLVLMYYAFNVAIIAILAVALTNIWPLQMERPSRDQVFLLALTIVGVATAASACLYLGNLRWSYAAVTAARADRFKERNDWNTVRAIFERSVAVLPGADHYRILLGNATLKQALQTHNAQERRSRFETAEAVLTGGYERRPLNTDFAANLADLYLNWALNEGDAQQRTLIAKRGAHFFRELQLLEPARFDAWNKSAYMDLVFFGQSDPALDKLHRSSEIAPLFDETMALTGDAYAFKARATTRAEERADLFTRAATAYQQAIERVSRYSYYFALGNVYSEMGRFPQAIDVYLKCVAKAPRDKQSEIDEAIARLYLKLGNREGAIIHARRALENAPPEGRRGLPELMNKITSPDNEIRSRSLVR